MRITLTTVVALAATLAPAAEPTKDQLAAAEAKVKAFRAAVAVPSGTTVAGSLDAAKGDFAAAAKSADDLVGKLPGLQTAAKNLAKVASDKDPKKREAEAQRFLKILEEANPNASIDGVDTLARDIAAASFAVVVEGTDTAFKLTAAELAKDPTAAKKRVADSVKAMTGNATRLETAAKNLKGIAARATSNHAILKEIEAKIGEFTRVDGAKDVVNSTAVQKSFDIGLLKKHTTLADAATKASAAATKEKASQDAIKRATTENAKLLDAK